MFWSVGQNQTLDDIEEACEISLLTFWWRISIILKDQYHSDVCPSNIRPVHCEKASPERVVKEVIATMFTTMCVEKRPMVAAELCND